MLVWKAVLQQTTQSVVMPGCTSCFVLLIFDNTLAPVSHSCSARHRVLSEVDAVGVCRRHSKSPEDVAALLSDKDLLQSPVGPLFQGLKVRHPPR